MASERSLQEVLSAKEDKGRNSIFNEKQIQVLKAIRPQANTEFGRGVFQSILGQVLQPDTRQQNLEDLIFERALTDPTLSHQQISEGFGRFQESGNLSDFFGSGQGAGGGIFDAIRQEARADNEGSDEESFFRELLQSDPETATLFERASSEERKRIMEQVGGFQPTNLPNANILDFFNPESRGRIADVQQGKRNDPLGFLLGAITSPLEAREQAEQEQRAEFTKGLF